MLQKHYCATEFFYGEGGGKKMQYTIKGKLAGALFNKYINKNGKQIEIFTVTLFNDRGFTKNDLVIEYRVDPILARKIGMDKPNFLFDNKGKEITLVGYPVFEFQEMKILVDNIILSK